MDYCLNCGGMIPEPNRAYGYVGKICYCPKNPAHQYQRPASKEKVSWSGGTGELQAFPDPEPAPTAAAEAQEWHCWHCHASVVGAECGLCGRTLDLSGGAPSATQAWPAPQPTQQAAQGRGEYRAVKTEAMGETWWNVVSADAPEKWDERYCYGSFSKGKDHGEAHAKAFAALLNGAAPSPSVEPKRCHHTRLLSDKGPCRECRVEQPMSKDSSLSKDSAPARGGDERLAEAQYPMVGHPLAIFSQSMEQRVSDLRRAFRNGLAKGLEMEREKFEQWRANVMNGVREKDAELAKLRASLAAAQNTVERYLENFQVQTDAIARSNKERDELRRECEEAKTKLEELSKCPNESWECAKIQRQLERELDAARAEAARLREAVEFADKKITAAYISNWGEAELCALVYDVQEKFRAALTEEAPTKQGEENG